MESFYFGLERPSKADKITKDFICVAVRHYTAQDINMITFREGDKFLILDDSDEFGLWLAKSLSTDRKGLIPSSYVMPETEL